MPTELPAPSSDVPKPKENYRKFWATTGALALIVLLIPLFWAEIRDFLHPKNGEKPATSPATGNSTGSGNVNGSVSGTGIVIGNNNNVTIINPPPNPPTPKEKHLTRDKVTAQVTKGAATQEPKQEPHISTGSVNAGPCSNIQIGGSNNTAGGNCTGAPPRVLTGEQITQLETNIAPYPGKIFIMYKQDDTEAYNIAKQIGDALTAAKWTLKQPVTPVEVVVQTGPPPHGMELSWPSEAATPGQNVRFDVQTPPGILGGSLMYLFRPNFSVRPLPTADPDWIHLVVFSNAPPK